MSAKLIQEISTDNSKNFKVAIMKREALAGNDQFFEGLTLGLHPLITFGVKQIPQSTVAISDEQLLEWEDFVFLCDELQQRNLTGHAARDAIHDTMLASGQAQWDDWFRRILMQDMKAGFSESTVNKGVEQAEKHILQVNDGIKKPEPEQYGFLSYSIPVETCQLAVDCEKRPQDMNGLKMVDIKLDGVRVLSHTHIAKAVRQTSRNGRDMENFPQVVEQLERFKVHFTEDMLVDAEIMSGEFQDLMRQVRRKRNVQTDDAILNIFDMLPLKEFIKGESTQTLLERREFLDAYIAEHWGDSFEDEFPNLAVIAYEIIDLDTDEGQARLMEINDLALAAKKEGIMLKDINSKYRLKRTPDWMKMKPYIEVDLAIKALYNGKPETKNEFILGGFTCVGELVLTEKLALAIDMPAGATIKIEVNCGGGFKAKERQDFWDAGDSQIGMIVEVRADKPTLSEGSDVWSLRFPRFRRFRGFEAGEKV